MAQLKTTKDISNFIGLVSGITNLIALPIQLFLLSRLIGWLGLGNTHLIYPAGTAAISGGLIFAPNLFSAALGYFDRTTFRTAFRNTTENLLYNAVPLRVKGRARAFIGGLLLPVGSIIGGLLLLDAAHTRRLVPADINWYAGPGLFAGIRGNSPAVRAGLDCPAGARRFLLLAGTSCL